MRAALFMLVGAMAPPACHQATVLNPSPSDALREENLRLREQVEQLTLRARELDAGLSQRRATAAATQTVDPAIDSAIPRVASVTIEGASEFVMNAGEPGATGSSAAPGAAVASDAPVTLRLWVLPRDGRGRFLQMVGRLHVSVAAIRTDVAPVELALATFDPMQIRDAWRSGFMGTHYAFVLPVAVPPELRSTPLTVTTRFDDALTGRSFEDQRRLAPARREAEMRAAEPTQAAGATP